MTSESTQSDIKDVGEASVNWQVQIGPDIEGPLEGVVNWKNSYFYVAPQSGLQIVYAELSTDGGSSWYQMPNNSWVNAATAQPIQYRINPQNTELKFLIALE